jgi:hypothetical protein
MGTSCDIARQAPKSFLLPRFVERRLSYWLGSPHSNPKLRLLRALSHCNFCQCLAPFRRFTPLLRVFGRRVAAFCRTGITDCRSCQYADRNAVNTLSSLIS